MHCSVRGVLQAKVGTLGSWRRGFYTFNFEALTEYPSRTSAVPRSVVFNNKDSPDQIDRITKVHRMPSAYDFMVDIERRNPSSGSREAETVTYRATSSEHAAEWYDMLLENLAIYKTAGTESRAASAKVVSVGETVI